MIWIYLWTLSWIYSWLCLKYLNISLNIFEYLWIFSWLCLKYLNIPEYIEYPWIYLKNPEYVWNIWIYLNILNISKYIEYPWIYLNIPEYIWIFLNIPEICSWISLWIYLWIYLISFQDYLTTNILNDEYIWEWRTYDVTIHDLNLLNRTGQGRFCVQRWTMHYPQFSSKATHVINFQFSPLGQARFFCIARNTMRSTNSSDLRFEPKQKQKKPLSTALIEQPVEFAIWLVVEKRRTAPEMEKTIL